MCVFLYLPIKMLILKLLTVYHLKSQGYCDCGHKIGRGDSIFCLDFCLTGAVESKDNREIPVSAVTRQWGRDCYWGHRLAATIQLSQHLPSLPRCLFRWIPVEGTCIWEAFLLLKCWRWIIKTEGLVRVF